ncbi:MAG: adenylate/guanylate cyclase domain-containing protein [Acidobacteriota bacterium]
MRLRVLSEDEPRVFELGPGKSAIGRGAENHVSLRDPSVSRRHCEVRPLAGGGWEVVDLGSTNGLLLDGTSVGRGRLVEGAILTLGIFQLQVEGLPPEVDSGAVGPPTTERMGPPPQELAQEAQVLLRLDDIGSVLGERVQEDRVLEALVELGRRLLQAEDVESVAERVMDAAFTALAVDRGFLFLCERSGLYCYLARHGERVERRPEGVVPVSTTILRQVVEQQVALVTADARADGRFSGGESIRLHQIRAALCVPLWSDERVIGVMHLDSPMRSEVFDERDLELATALASYAAMAIEGRRNAADLEVERRSRERLERYHSPAVVEEILRLEGIERHALRPVEATVMFADLVGFTAMSEKASPGAVATLLSDYFDRAVAAVFEHGGTLDKFIGDCVMAFFGAPAPQPNHAERGVRAALALQAATDSWNLQRRAEGREPVSVRIALNSGPVVVGEVGSEQRVEYTVLGDTVNVAARLEDVVTAPGEVVVGEATHQRLAETFLFESLGDHRLQGLERPIRAYRVLSPAGGGGVGAAPRTAPVPPRSTD